MKLINKVKESKFLSVLAVLIVGCLVILIIRFTYAYFAAQINDARDDVTLGSDLTDVFDFEIGDPLSIAATPTTLPENGTNLISETYAKASLLANTTNNVAEYSYWVYFNISNNTFVYSDGSIPEIILTVTDPDGNPVTNIEGLTYGTYNGVAGFDVTTQNGTFAVASDYTITSNSSTDATEQTWNFTLTYLNQSYDQSVNFGNGMTTEVSMTKEENTILFANYIVSLYDASNEGVNGLYYHDADLANGAQDNSYRYSGANPNNYVCFGATGADCQNAENQYRIIGVFNNQVKLIKLIGYNEIAWDDRNKTINNILPIAQTTCNGSNIWNETTKPDIYTTLNETYYNILESEWQNLIAESTWQVGGMAFSTTNTAKQYYDAEVGTGQSGYEETMKIGLMYVSDYGYGASPENWTLPLGSTSSNYGTDNWLYLGNTEWIISSSSIHTGDNCSVFYINNLANIWHSSPEATNAVRPSFYLESSVTLTGGTGTQTDPYIIA